MKQKKIARIISFILHPIPLAILVPFFIAYRQTANIFTGFTWSLISFLFLLLTAVTFMLCTSQEKFDSFEKRLDIANPKHRDVFYNLCAFFAVLYLIMLLFIKNVLSPLIFTTLGFILGVIAFSIINRYMKISIHTAVVTAFIIIIGILYGFFPFLGVLLLLPVIIWCRLTLQKHSTKEILAGFLVGSIISIATVFLYKHIPL